jgi:hypothetical protein
MSNTNEDSPYRCLDPLQITTTVERLALRIDERFPGAGLGHVCRQLLVISRQAHERARWISQPIYLLRVAVWTLVALLALVAIFSVTLYRVSGGRIQSPAEMSTSEFLEAVDAGTSELIVLAAGVYSLMSLERRIKRNRALSAIHELRSVAHLIDMHQLTKDPERLLRRWVITEHSPRPTMNAFQLARYLDYCSEMLSLIGKIASVYVQRFDDPIAIASVNEVEDLTTGLSGKIWQKIMILNSFPATGNGRSS